MISGDHFRLFAAVYLVLRREGTVLLSCRTNTGFMDGYWSMVAGHLDGGESALAAMVREAREEAGIVVDMGQLTPRLSMHRIAPDREYIDLYFEAAEWQGEIINLEPRKCSGLQFFPLDDLPKNTVPSVRCALECIQRGQTYVEFGWEDCSKIDGLTKII